MHLPQKLASSLVVTGLALVPVVALTACQENAAPPAGTIAAGFAPGAQSTTPEQPAGSPEETSLVTGEIVSVGGDSVEIRSSQGGGATMVRLTEQTVVMIDGRTAEAADLATGQIAIASVLRKDDGAVAVSISVRTSGGT